MAERAQPLIELHLLETPDLPRSENLAVRFAKQGSRVVEQHYPRSNPVAGRVYINPTQYFERVTAEMWEYHRELLWSIIWLSREHQTPSSRPASDRRRWWP